MARKGQEDPSPAPEPGVCYVIREGDLLRRLTAMGKMRRNRKRYPASIHSRQRNGLRLALRRRGPGPQQYFFEAAQVTFDQPRDCADVHVNLLADQRELLRQRYSLRVSH